MVSPTKNTAIQIVLSIIIAFFGLVAIYAIHRANSKSNQTNSYNIIDSSPKSGDPIKESLPRVKKEIGVVHLPESRKVKMDNHPDPINSSGLIEQLKSFKYDSYLKVNGTETAWISHGDKKLEVEEGTELEGEIRIDEINENFILLSAANGQISQEILFTKNPNKQKPKLPQQAKPQVKQAVNRTKFLPTATKPIVTKTPPQVKQPAGRVPPSPGGYGPPTVPGQLQRDQNRRRRRN